MRKKVGEADGNRDPRGGEEGMMRTSICVAGVAGVATATGGAPSCLVGGTGIAPAALT